MPELKQKYDQALAKLTAPGAPFELIDCPQAGACCQAVQERAKKHDRAVCSSKGVWRKRVCAL